MKVPFKHLVKPLAGVLLCTSSVVFAENATPEADVIATVNGTAITIAERTAISKQLIARGQQTDDARITEELINLQLLKQKAMDLGLDKDPAVISQLSSIHTRLLANAAMSSLTDSIKLTDEQINAEYEAQVAKLEIKEFKASHILVDDEAAAIAIIKEVNDGADFGEVAKAKSTGPSGPNGGDLGWFTAKSMVPEFSAAVMQMKKDEVTAQPVKTKFGYHVIKLMDTRDAPKPTLDVVKGEIVEILTQKQLRTQIEALRKDAEIVIK